MQSIRKYRSIILILTDILVIMAAYLISGFLTEDNKIFFTSNFKQLISNTIIFAIIINEAIFFGFRIYKNITRYENGKDYIIYILLSLFSGAITFLASFLAKTNMLEFKQIILATLFYAAAMVSYRVVIRFILTTTSEEEKNVPQNKKNLLIIGAGEAAREIIKTIKSTMKSTYNIIGLIDDNPNKLGYAISGIKILGDRDSIVEICKEKNVDVIFFSISNIGNKNKKEILNICQETGAKLRVLPGTADIIRKKSMVQNLRDVEIEDILGREPIVLHNEKIGELIKGHTVLVTGGGGSIGSELCRQIIKFEPETLVIFDIYENNLYNIEMELKQNHYDEKINIVGIIGSVRDKARLEKVFKEYKPYLVFHAAAHKHVPLMEVSPLEAIKNNVFGTLNTVNMADKYNTKRFILISTDKAVNPTNIMGASKRLCEMIVQTKNKVSNTEYAAVRFGNVLGSNGSVLPLFKSQIAKGGPVTVTHKEITRFFMTIPEAVSLVLQAMSYAEGGEIFVLDMGEPVKIYDLAVSLIKLSGLEPEVDIQIKITGLRPGEKLYEELLMNEEGLKQTEHEKIFVGQPETMTEEQLENKLCKLKEMIKDEDVEIDKVKQTIKQVVPTYHEPTEANKEIKNSRKEISNKKSIIKDAIKVLGKLEGQTAETQNN